MDERGLVIKVSLLKTYREPDPPAAENRRTIRVRVQVSGTAESMTGLQQALEAIELLDDYLREPDIRLEEAVENDKSMQSVRRIPNTRIIQQVSKEDSFVSDPASDEVQHVDDDRIVLITFSHGGYE